MKFFLRFFIGLIVAVALIVFFYYLITDTRAVTGWVTNNMSATFIEPEKPEEPRQRGPTPTPLDKRTMLANAAFQNGVEIVSFTDYGDYVVVELTWSGGVSTKGMDIVQGLLDQGRLKDFEDLGTQVSKNNRGDNVYHSTLKLYIR